MGAREGAAERKASKIDHRSLKGAHFSRDFPYLSIPWPCGWLARRECEREVEFLKQEVEIAQQQRHARRVTNDKFVWTKGDAEPTKNIRELRSRLPNFYVRSWILVHVAWQLAVVVMYVCRRSNRIEN